MTHFAHFLHSACSDDDVLWVLLMAKLERCLCYVFDQQERRRFVSLDVWLMLRSDVQLMMATSAPLTGECLPLSQGFTLEVCVCHMWLWKIFLHFITCLSTAYIFAFVLTKLILILIIYFI